jgi:nitrogen regulatory protein P-II 1
MKYRKVTALIPTLELEKVEQALIGVPGMTVSTVRGFGEYRNHYARDTMTDCVRVELFTDADKADEIVRKIARTVHQCLSSDGIVAVTPVEELLHIREFEDG